MSDIRTLQMQMLELEGEHRELDHLIETLEQGPVLDELAIRRLKKRKLALKDRLNQLAEQLRPNEPA
ncbi:MAG: YdcH family protein [Burkholderiaceae bacterium]|nr:YdcH family protein [Burkholderiaceae bacterium]